MVRKSNRKKSTPVRYNAARVDASVGSIAKRIERDYKLPPGSVALVLRSGRKARRDGSIASLLKEWGW
jgi:hypothetical protein